MKDITPSHSNLIPTGLFHLLVMIKFRCNRIRRNTLLDSEHDYVQVRILFLEIVHLDFTGIPLAVHFAEKSMLLAMSSILANFTIERSPEVEVDIANLECTTGHTRYSNISMS